MDRHYIDGRWQAAAGTAEFCPVFNPATEQPVAMLREAAAADVEHAVAAARGALGAFARTTPRQRAALLSRIGDLYARRLDEIALAVTTETGVPYERVARRIAAPAGLRHLRSAVAVPPIAAQTAHDAGLRLREPAGVCALITPAHAAMAHVTRRLASALLAGCAVVLKPSSRAPLSAQLLAEIVHEAGVPAGVFNLVYGSGADIAARLAAHAQIDLLSFAGSAANAAQFAGHGAAALKRVHVEIADRSTALLLDDARLDDAVAHSVHMAMGGGEDGVPAPSRLLVPASLLDDARQLAVDAVARLVVGDPLDARTTTGPSAGQVAYRQLQASIAAAIGAGARPLTGGLGRPDGLVQGYYARPTVLAAACGAPGLAHATCAGPLLTLLAYRTEDEALAIADGSTQLQTWRIWSGDAKRARTFARRLRADAVHLNDDAPDVAPACEPHGHRLLALRHGADDFSRSRTIAGAAGDRDRRSSTRSQR